MKPRAFRPEGPDGIRLEPRALLSSFAPRQAMVATASTVLRTSSRGTYKAAIMPDGAPMLTLKGPAAGRKQMAFSGTLHGIAPNVSGKATGSATIGPRANQLRVTLVGPSLSAADKGALSSDYTVTVTGGTGKYANATGTGEVVFGLKQVGKETATRSQGKFVASLTITLN